MTTFGYLCWHLANLGTTLFTIGMAMLVVVVPTGLADPHLVRYLQHVVYVLCVMYFVGFILQMFFPVPDDYNGVFG